MDCTYLIYRDIVPFYGTYAVVTPLRKAASYEQRKTNLGSSP